MTRKQEILEFFNDPNRVKIYNLTPKTKKKIIVLAKRYVHGAIHAPAMPRYQRPTLACETRKGGPAR